MYCSYHPINTASVQCSHCGRALCTACDHRIKGYAYCQDCIVQGVGRLAQPQVEVRTPQMPLYQARPKRAALFALIPGLGAVYNRQNTKALVHFLVTFGLAETADTTNLVLFGMGAFVFWLYTILDAYRTAEAARYGIDIAEEEEKMRQALRQRSFAWGGLLVLMGVLFFTANLNLFTLQPQRVWPLLLIGVGIIFLQDYFRHRTSDSAEVGYKHAPRSVVTSSLPLPAYPNSIERSPTEEQRRH